MENDKKDARHERRLGKTNEIFDIAFLLILSSSIQLAFNFIFIFSSISSTSSPSMSFPFSVAFCHLIDGDEIILPICFDFYDFSWNVSSSFRWTKQCNYNKNNQISFLLSLFLDAQTYMNHFIIYLFFIILLIHFQHKNSQRTFANARSLIRLDWSWYRWSVRC